MITVAMFLICGSVAHAANPRPIMKEMPATRRAPERAQRAPAAVPPQTSSRSYRSPQPSVGCISGDCVLARARAEQVARTGTRADAMARLNEKYRQREVQRQEERAAIRARFENQNIDAGR